MAALLVQEKSWHLFTPQSVLKYVASFFTFVLLFKLCSEFRQLLLDEETKIVSKATIVLCTNAVAQGRLNIKIDIEEQKFNLVNKLHLYLL